MSLRIESPAASALQVSSLNESHSHSPRKTRSACDRCHSQKLRCMRKNGKSGCDRCLKLPITCRFSPRAGRNSLGSKSSNNQVLENVLDGGHEPVSSSEDISVPASDMFSGSILSNVNENGAEIEIGFTGGVTTNFDFCYTTQESFVGLLNATSSASSWEPDFMNSLHHSAVSDLTLVPVSQNTISNANSPSLQDTSGPSPIVTSYTLPSRIPTTAYQNLASINIAFHECFSDLPPRAPDMPGNDMPISAKQRLFKFDDLFHHTTSFITILKTFSLPTPNPHTLYLDEPTLHLLISTHILLTKIYSTIHELIQTCISFSLLPSLSKNWAIILPQLKIGPLIASPSVHVDVENPLVSKTAKAMYMLMITMASSQLWGELVGLMGVGTSVELSEKESGMESLVELWERVGERTESLLGSIDATKHLLLWY